LRVVQFGLGAIGQAAARLVLEKPALQLVGAVERDPQFLGRDLGEVLELGHPLGIKVTDQPPAAAAAIHCTTSNFTAAAAQISDIVRAGMHCVTSCEEALLPAFRDAPAAAALDALCREHKVSVVGTGVNPGFVMDTLPALLTSVCQHVHSIHVTRVVDAGTRRPALQKKVGAGLTPAEFDQLVHTGKIRHVGLTDSLMFLAEALGWDDVDVTETVSPVLGADGNVAGVRQLARGGHLTLELEMYVGAPNPRDEIFIEGVPPLHVVIQGGTAGDLATPAMLVNLLPRLVEARPGLHTMRTLALPHLET